MNLINKVKQTVPDLALFGGQALFEQPLYVGRPNVLQKSAILAEIESVLDSYRLTNNGPKVQALEAALCQYLKVPHCILVANATLGLMAVLKALDLKGEVIVPSFTFPATAHVLPWCGLKPVFCDVDPVSHQLDPASVQSLISPDTSAILGVHLWGENADIDALQAIAEQHQLRLIFDAAHALGCSYQGRMIGNFGDAEVFSFHATKFVNSLEGGAITTHNAELAAKLRLWINFGFDQHGVSILPGFNAKMNEISAVVGLQSLADIPSLIDLNYKRYKAYQAGLAAIPQIKLYTYQAHEERNYQYIILEVQDQSELSRDQLHRILQAEGVICRRYFSPGCHRLVPYQDLFYDLPATDALSQRVLALPNGTGVSLDQVQAICDLIQYSFAQADQIKAHWPASVDTAL